MALSPEVQARFEERKKALAAAKEGATPTAAAPVAKAPAKPKAAQAPTPPVEDEQADDAQVDEEGETVVNAKGELVVGAVVPAAGSRAEKIRTLSDLLAAKEAQATVVQGEIDDLLNQIAEACK